METSQLQAGDYLCVRAPGIVSTLIALVTGSRYSHVAIATGEGTLIEAEPGGVRIRDVSEYAGCPMAANTGEPMLSQQRETVVDFARNHIGEPYNWDADVADGLAALGLRWRLATRFAAGRKAVMCSQLAVQAGNAAGLDWSCGQQSAAQVTPGMLARRPGVQTYPLRSST